MPVTEEQIWAAIYALDMPRKPIDELEKLHALHVDQPHHASRAIVKATSIVIRAKLHLMGGR